MATNLISWPFRLAPNGNVVTRPDNTPEYYAEEIAQLVLTKENERPLVPTFGIEDPTFSFVDPRELSLKSGKFGIPVRIVDVATQQVTENKQDVTVYYEPLDNVTLGQTRVNVNDVVI
jgi:hypothetical protein